MPLTSVVHVKHIGFMTLQQWMDAHHYDDAKLAAEVKVVSRSQISRIRRGGHTSLRTAAAIEEFTGIPARKFAHEPKVAAVPGQGKAA
jgi:transcriptional regulator with XRE-family HTH domain